MDVTMLSGNALRIKGKNAAIVINPTKETGKTEANCIVRLNDDLNFSDSKIEESRITIKGPGEFEVGGIKISVLKANDNLTARIDIEAIKILIGEGEDIVKVQEKIENSDILIVKTDNKFNYSQLTSFDPKVILAYGQNTTELSKSLGKDGNEKTHKFSTAVAKLPTEMQFFQLGQ